MFSDNGIRTIRRHYGRVHSAESIYICEKKKSGVLTEQELQIAVSLGQLLLKVLYGGWLCCGGAGRQGRPCHSARLDPHDAADDPAAAGRPPQLIVPHHSVLEGADPALALLRVLSLEAR